jgi:hypothetical protein
MAAEKPLKRWRGRKYARNDVRGMEKRAQFLKDGYIWFRGDVFPTDLMEVLKLWIVKQESEIQGIYKGMKCGLKTRRCDWVCLSEFAFPRFADVRILLRHFLGIRTIFFHLKERETWACLLLSSHSHEPRNDQKNVKSPSSIARVSFGKFIQPILSAFNFECHSKRFKAFTNFQCEWIVIIMQSKINYLLHKYLSNPFFNH